MTRIVTVRGTFGKSGKPGEYCSNRAVERRTHAICRHRATPARGFTLIEVMIVVVILGILASIVVPRIVDRPDEARVTKAKTDIRGITSALELYRLDNFAYPSANQGLRALVELPTAGPLPKHWKTGGYLDRLPLDPWGNPYQYLQPGLRGNFDLYSFGADGRAEGNGMNADIGNWDPD